MKEVTLIPGEPIDMDVTGCSILPTTRGPAIKLVGTVGGALAYIRGSHDAMLEAMIAAGIVGQLPDYDVHELPADGVGVRIKHLALSLFIEPPKDAGERPTLVILTRDDGKGATPARGDGRTIARPAGSGAPGTAPAPANGRHPSQELYLETTKFVLEEVVPLYREHAIPVTGGDVHAMVATQVISRTRR